MLSGAFGSVTGNGIPPLPEPGQARLEAYREAPLAGLHWAKESKTYSLEVLREKQKTFGAIVLQSDLDLPAETAYKAYEKHWEIEIFMRFYKSACEFDETRVQDDYSVIGSEFCDFLSTLLTSGS